MRPYGVTVFGCTGNAGRATALFAIKIANGRPVALAGRNESKVAALKTSVCTELGHSGDNVHIIVADANDPASMLAMASSTNVLIACAGPFGRYGEAAVAACIEGGAHYVDITGEVPWVNRMANKYGDAARKAGVSILSFAGYDCMPAELALFLAGQPLQKAGGIERLDMVFEGKGGGFPKGTLNTILDGFEGKGRVKREAGDAPIVPAKFKSAQREAVGPLRWLFPHWTSHTGEITVQNFMSTINVPVMCRAAAQFGYEPFTIRDRLRVGGPRRGLLLNLLTLCGLLPFIGYVLGMVGGGLLLMMPMFRAWLKTRLETYSFGGNADGSVECDAHATSKDGKAEARVVITCDGDAGIYATGRFAACVAWTLFNAEASSKSDRVLKGFHSPVAALHASGLLFGDLEKAGVQMSVTTTPKGEGPSVVALSSL